MSLERNLIVAILSVLLASLLVGAGLTYVHAKSRVGAEMQAAMAVGQRIVQNAADDGEGQTDPLRRLGLIVNDFNGDRHLRAVLRGPKGQPRLVSTPQAAQDAAPRAFFDLVSGTPIVAAIDLPAGLQGQGTLFLETDAHNEVSEEWSDLKLELGFLGGFFCLILSLSLRTLRAAFRPMEDLRRALKEVGSGNYGVRLHSRKYRELAAVQDGFHAMTLRLADMETHNRLLQTRLRRIQEDERRELARDLHDEVAPFLFAVSADASLIGRHLQEKNYGQVAMRAEAILGSAGHMQKHLRHVLSRLMPDVLLDLGLSGAIDSLVHFWKSRKPDVEFGVEVQEDGLDDASSAVVFRIVQESLSNAMRHADASRVDIAVQNVGDGIAIDVFDDGRGLSESMEAGAVGSLGLGVLGMRERARSVGGSLRVGNRKDRSGVHVHAILLREGGDLALSEIPMAG